MEGEFFVTIECVWEDTRGERKPAVNSCRPFIYIWRIVSRVAQPGECISCAPSAVSFEVATRQRRENSSYLGARDH